MWSAIPIIGWAIGAFFAFCMAVPFWFLWTVCGIGQRYFGFLPSQFVDLGFWNTVGLFLTISILKFVLLPSSFRTSVTNEKK